MVNVVQFIWILFFHWIADFVFQNDEMAMNKSKSVKWLAIHSLFYMVVLGLLSMVVFATVKEVLIFALINGIGHFIIDGVTSQFTSFFYKREMRHWFFVTIGFDQFLHASLLLLTI